MHLHLKHPNGHTTDYRFTRGPIYLGRHSQCQILLPKRTVSRQHAVIYLTPDGQTILQDLRSANGTLLNNKEIQKTALQSGDCIQIDDFTIDIDLEESPHAVHAIRMDDTLIGVNHRPQIIVRDLHMEHAPDITLPADRALHFVRATKRICQATGPQDTLDTILSVLFDQFHPSKVWCALREGTSGPMTMESGRTAQGQTISLNDIELNHHILKAVQHSQFLLLPQNINTAPSAELRSAMIAPLLESNGSVGVLYVDNSGSCEHYSLRDLDYLVLLAIHIAAVFENF